MIKVNVEINNKSWKEKIRNPEKYLSSKLNKISKIVPVFKKKKIIFTILLTNSFNMKKLNKKFRKLNKPTDVLSFPFLSNRDFRLSKEKKIYIGDIATSYEIIKHRSQKSNFYLEFDKVWIHGLLHLIGHDHIKNIKTFGNEENATPIKKELYFIEKYLEKFEGINILIDDIRLFNNSFQNYPKKNYLVNWCKENNFEWEIEQDIFICKKIKI